MGCSDKLSNAAATCSSRVSEDGTLVPTKLHSAQSLAQTEASPSSAFQFCQTRSRGLVQSGLPQIFLTVPRLKSICFPSLYWRVVMSVWCSLKEEPYNRSRRVAGNDCDEPEPTSVDPCQDGQGGISNQPYTQCFQGSALYLIRAKLKVSIGVIIASLTEKGEPYYNGLN